MTSSGGKSVTFTIRSAPFIHDPDYMPEVYDAIGRIVILWSRFESQINTIQMISSEIARHHSVDVAVQQSFKGKMRAILRAFKSVPPLNGLLGSFEALAPEIFEASDDRNALVHSALGGYLPEQKGFELKNIRYDGKIARFVTHNVTLTQLEQMIVIIDRLNTRLLHFNFAVGNAHRSYENRPFPA